MEYCKRCIQLDPQNPKYYLKRGLAFADYFHNYIAALDELNVAYELDKNDPVIIEEIRKVTDLVDNNSRDAGVLKLEDSK